MFFSGFPQKPGSIAQTTGLPATPEKYQFLQWVSSWETTLYCEQDSLEGRRRMHLMHNTELASLFRDVVCTQIHLQKQGGVLTATDLTQKSHNAGYNHFLLQKLVRSPSVCVHVAASSFFSITLQPKPLSFALLGQCL